MTLSEELINRGFIHQFTAENLKEILDNGPQVIYHGIDPSADSAHAGNFVVWMLLRHLRQAGHRVIFLVGGGTGMIGDPKPDAERTLKAESETDANVVKLREQAAQIIGDNDILFVNNKDWLKEVSLLTFLRDIGKHFTVNELIKKDAIAKRLSSDTGISYTEFAYPLLQGYDYFVLNERHNCTVQVGGSDQWGNIVAGVELIRRKTQKTAHAITVPLIIDKATGKKFGKSEGNAVWLSSEKTSPFTFYQFWLNQSDMSVEDYLKLFTMLPLTEITTIIEEHKKNPAARVAQKALAYAVTTIVHGEQAAVAATSVSQTLFGEKSLDELTPNETDILLENAPTFAVQEPLSIIDLLVASGLASSKREARTFITEGAVTIDTEKVTNPEVVIEPTTKLQTLRRGKKQYVVLHT
jgi:tyrosyl-tRNA synthetase